MTDRRQPASPIAGAGLKRRAATAVAAVFLASLSSSAQSQDRPSALVGKYLLTGIREVGAELILSSDGSFEFAMAYGGAEQQTLGHWSVIGSSLVLIANPAKAASLSLGGAESALFGGYGEDPKKPTILAVEVSTPRLGMAWSNMVVTAEFGNGQSRSGTTGRNGMIGFLRLDDQQWQGALVRSVTVAYPKAGVAPQRFDVAPGVKALKVLFEPGAMVAPAFTKSTLAIDERAHRVLVVVSGDLGKPGWRLTRP